MRFTIERLKILKDGITTPIDSRAITYDKIQVQTSPDGGKLERDVIRTIQEIERIDKKLETLREKFTHRKDKAEALITEMQEGQCRRFLLDYYIDGKSLKEIETEYRFEGNKSIYTLKKRSIKKFEKTFKR
jgi:hypothetical protein